MSCKHVKFISPSLVHVFPSLNQYSFVCTEVNKDRLLLNRVPEAILAHKSGGRPAVSFHLE